MRKFNSVLIYLFFLSAGIVIGGYLFSQSQPRSFLSINRCQNCLSPKDLYGLVASIWINKFPESIPFVVFETDKTIVFKHPFPKAHMHYVIAPKKDIKNIGEISEEDAPFITDAFFVIRHIVEEEKLSNYWVYTNGPGFQDVAYLHFNMIDE